MQINWWTLALQAINVLVLIWLLTRFLYRPVLDVIERRQEMADRLLADAASAKSDAERQNSALKQQNEALSADAERLHAEARAAADVERGRLLEQARAEASARIEQAQAAADAERSHMAKQLEAKAGELAGQMTEKLLARIDTGATFETMLAALTARLEKLDDADRARLLGDDPLTITTPAPLRAPERERCSAAIAAVAPGHPQITFAVDPALIAGVELHGPHSLVRNSWRADLDAMIANIQEDDHGERR
ncbi:hypothetical protein KY084_04965 [Stakelama sp. CBK3Z-3]|uniref:ATP synthase subunit b n=1 Tax=Stakelama flava TaxID=2860338 RepID=A0ABS6XJ28_9SPHN|nr:hypothetical protein [Stakelama flava]MBW4330224.1 hypothetical protein [Stakelama flava]